MTGEEHDRVLLTLGSRQTALYSVMGMVLIIRCRQHLAPAASCASPSLRAKLAGWNRSLLLPLPPS